ncbi:MAG: PhoH family protein [Myxococcota bacterium]|nr:PhoH family protein [Myxococcales bacterium]
MPRRRAESNLPEDRARQTLVFDDNHAAALLYGPAEATLRAVEDAFGVSVHARGNEVRVVGAGEGVAAARKVLEELYALAKAGRDLEASAVRDVIRMVDERPDVNVAEVQEDLLSTVGARRRIGAKNLAQKRYVDLMRSHDVVMAIGPAGTGKTYLAMALAVAALNRHEVSRVILARPAVEAGERLGFLPGDLAEKVNPYLRPLYDALHDMMDMGRAAKLMERGVIEVAPLAFMRGRTLNDCFVILDEAQNTTPEQMKMFLTRLGFNSKAVVTGDVTQTDLAPGTTSGLAQALEVLRDVEGIGVMRFTNADVVRHPLVQSIIEAYERSEGAAKRRAEERDGGR